METIVHGYVEHGCDEPDPDAAACWKRDQNSRGFVKGWDFGWVSRHSWRAGSGDLAPCAMTARRFHPNVHTSAVVLAVVVVVVAILNSTQHPPFILNQPPTLLPMPQLG